MAPPGLNGSTKARVLRRFRYTPRPSSTAASIEAKSSSVEQHVKRLPGHLGATATHGRLRCTAWRRRGVH